MAEFAYQTTAITGPATSHAAAAAGGDTVRPNDRGFLWVKNSHATLTRTVTVVVPGTTWGQANPDVAIVVPAVGERLIGPLSGGLAGAAGVIDFTYSDSAANLTCAAVRL